MKIQRKLFVMGVVVSMVVGATFSLTYAEGRVTGRTVHFTPSRPVWIGEIVKISVGITVTGGPVNLTAIVEQTTPRHVGPPPPTIVLGTFNPGDHIVDVYRYTIPSVPPERICFTIKIPGGEFRNVCLKRRRSAPGDVMGEWHMDIESSGKWVALPAPATVPFSSTEKPDLRIVGRLDMDRIIRVENIGRAPVNYVRVGKECFVEGRWVQTVEFEKPQVLPQGGSIPFSVGRLASARGPCPAGTTKVRLIVDPRNEIDEMNENNNMVEASTLADLRIVDFDCRPHNRVYTLFIKISNTGVGNAGPFTWDVSVHRDGEWGSFIGQRQRGLDSGRRVEISKTVTGLVREGERLRLRIDGFNEVPEINEDDNFREASVRGREVPW
ncbi:MAG: CARDB domain-containing protein [bacterium]